MSASDNQAVFLAALPEEAKKHLDPASPLPMRMMAAKGMAPLPPREMVVVLCGLSVDSDEKIATAAAQTVVGLPDNLLGGSIETLPDTALGVLARVLIGSEEPRLSILEKIVTNRQTPDEAIALVAPSAPAAIAEIIANNQERCLRSAEIVGALRENPNLLQSSRDRLFDFLVRQGVIYEGIEEFQQAMGRLSPNEVEAATGEVSLPAGLDGLLEDSAEADARAEGLAAEIEAVDSEQAPERIPLLKLLTTLNVAQKISLAIRGNKEARTLLLRDRNRLVCTAAIRNPRITDPEVLSAAQSRSVMDDVIRIIASSKEMSRSYMVKKALVYNPKTPVQTAMRFLNLLRQSDLAGVARSRNVPTSVSTQAKRLLARKK